ncbi:hypothetical protein PHYPSEUDO_006929 [Phytophthora pseudosyringae]|uniref:Uncharacterized protein n=1 Tax=Phytophthora pseudosyringae TaxID=221518 RepID=A0A8T1VKK1_9STRA|nr:hypothetical protein PHYPSEUDO_006929 [Phytophthora pseudosyringae]
MEGYGLVFDAEERFPLTRAWIDAALSELALDYDNDPSSDTSCRFWGKVCEEYAPTRGGDRTLVELQTECEKLRPRLTEFLDRAVPSNSNAGCGHLVLSDHSFQVSGQGISDQDRN